MVFFRHTEIGEEVSRHAVPSGPPNQVTTVLREMIESHSQFAPIHQLECEVMDVIEALLEKRQDMVIGVHVQPNLIRRVHSLPQTADCLEWPGRSAIRLSECSGFFGRKKLELMRRPS